MSRKAQLKVQNRNVKQFGSTADFQGVKAETGSIGFELGSGGDM